MNHSLAQSEEAQGKQQYPGTRRHQRILLAVGAVSMLVAGGLFFAIAEDIATGDPLVLLDARVANWLHAHAPPGLTRFFLQVSLLNGVAAISTYTAVVAGLLAWERDWYWARRIAVIVPSGMLFNTVLKHAYQRIRPAFDHAPVTLTTYSFPSGHTAGAMLFYGMLAVILISRLASFSARVACAVTAVLMVTMVAFSRIYLGVHFLSDVVAAASASVAWIAFGLIAVNQFEAGARSSH